MNEPATIPLAGRPGDVVRGPLLAGTLDAVAFTVRIDPGIIRGWLPKGVRLPDPCPNPYPLSIVWGWQHAVTAYPGGGRLMVPWRLSYAEIITAVSGLQLTNDAKLSWNGSVTYLPRLYMNSWRAALLGRSIYGFSKAFARIEASDRVFHAVSRRGEPLISATVADESPDNCRTPPSGGLFDEPVVLGAGGRVIVARFEADSAMSQVRPVTVDVNVGSALLSYLPAIERRAVGIDRQPDGAYRIATAWTLRQIA